MYKHFCLRVLIFFILKNNLDSIARIFILFTEKKNPVVGKPQVKYQLSYFHSNRFRLLAP